MGVEPEDEGDNQASGRRKKPQREVSSKKGLGRLDREALTSTRWDGERLLRRSSAFVNASSVNLETLSSKAKEKTPMGAFGDLKKTCSLGSRPGQWDHAQYMTDPSLKTFDLQRPTVPLVIDLNLLC